MYMYIYSNMYILQIYTHTFKYNVQKKENSEKLKKICLVFSRKENQKQCKIPSSFCISIGLNNRLPKTK